MAIDTLKVAKRLQEAGFSEPQAEAVVAAVREGSENADLATKRDLTDFDVALRRDLADLDVALRSEISGLRTELKAEMREMELRLEVKIEAAKADVMNRMVALFLGGLLVNIITVLGAMFAAVKLVGH
jgi:hypothetical protein